MRTLAVSLNFCLLLNVCSKSYGAVFSPGMETDIRSFIDVSMNCHHIPGMTLTVVKGNEVWSSGFGTADFSSGKLVDSDSLFNIGSVTKSFTATLLGILLSEKGLDWNAKVTDILGSEYEFVDSVRTKELTLRDLLSHRTGLATLDLGLLAGEPDSTRASLCKRLKYLPEKRSMRDGFIYNNYLYMMLGHVVEVLGGDTWENLVKSKIFDPLGMNSSRILRRPPDVLEIDVARPYIYRDDQFQNGTLEIYSIHPSEPAGAILSTGKDMAKWLHLHLHDGKTETEDQLIDKNLIKDMHWVTSTFNSQDFLKKRFLTRPQYPVDEIQIGYGYAWFVSAYRGYKNVWHSGGLFSYITLFWVYPDMDIGIFASVNGPAFKSLSIDHLTVVFYYLSDHLLGLNTWLNETTACTFPEPWVNKTDTEQKERETPMTVDKLDEFEGSYSNTLLPPAVVLINSSRLLLNINRMKGVLLPSSEKDRFLWQVTEPWEIAVSYTDNNNETIHSNVTFLRDGKTGDVNRMQIALEVNMTYTKGSLKVNKTSSAGIFASSCIFNFLVAFNIIYQACNSLKLIMLLLLY